MLKHTKISQNAQQAIDAYFNLPFPNHAGIRCPYFNNAKTGHRGQLKVLAGKGTPQEIVEEAKIISIQYKQPIFSNSGISSDEIRAFLVDNNLGIDCSGFISNVFQAHFAAQSINFLHTIFIAPKRRLLRWLISRLRPTEQISVKVYTSEKNSHTVNLQNISAGDLIIMLQTGPQKKRDHILLITATENNTISYAHARAWSSEGRYGHGVSRGTITIANINKPLTEQIWTENGKINTENETFLEATGAATLEIKRLHIWK